MKQCAWRVCVFDCFDKVAKSCWIACQPFVCDAIIALAYSAACIENPTDCIRFLLTASDSY
eukprot:2513534-Pyramimonas_sp.AAC.2